MFRQSTNYINATPLRDPAGVTKTISANKRINNTSPSQSQTEEKQLWHICPEQTNWDGITFNWFPMARPARSGNLLAWVSDYIVFSLESEPLRNKICPRVYFRAIRITCLDLKRSFSSWNFLQVGMLAELDCFSLFLVYTSLQQC